MSRDHDRRDRREDERVRYEDEDDEILTYERRRPAPPPQTRLRERSPTPPGRRGRVVEDEHLVQRERRYYDDGEDNDSIILPAAARRRHPPPPAVIPDDMASDLGSSNLSGPAGRRRVSPPPPRPGRLIRRQSSVETFDRRPARRAYDLDRIDHDDGRPPVNVPIPLPIRRRRDSSAERHEREYYHERERERDRGGRERRETTDIEEIRIEPDRIHYEDRRDGRDEEFEMRRRVEREHFSEHDDRGRAPRAQFEESRVVSEHERREILRAPSIVSSDSSGTERSRSRGSGGKKSEYPKKGKTRMPARLVSEQVLIDLGYPFIREGNTLVLQVALGQDNIDDVLKLSRDYKKSQTEIVESKTTKTKVKTSSGAIIKEKVHQEEVYTAPAPAPVAAPAPLPPAPQPQYQPQYAPPPLPPPPQVVQQVVYTSPPAVPPAPYVPAPEPAVVMAPAASPAYSTTHVHIRDVSPARSYTASYMPSAYSPVETSSMALVPAGARQPELAPVIYDAGSPAIEYTEEAAVGPLAVVAVDSDRVRIRSKSRSRHRSRHRSHSTHYYTHRHSHSHGDGALYAHFHDSRDRDRRHDDHYYYEERDYYEPPSSSGRELVRAERLSTGELVLYQEEVERIEEPRNGVRIEKDKKGRMAISVPKYR